jgi:hypothetical protein
MLSHPLRCFAAVLAVFHSSEFLLAYVYNRRDLGWHSAHEARLCVPASTDAHAPGFLFSRPYCAAMGFACLEYALELWFAPGLKARRAGVRLHCANSSRTTVVTRRLRDAVAGSAAGGRRRGSEKMRHGDCRRRVHAHGGGDEEARAQAHNSRHLRARAPPGICRLVPVGAGHAAAAAKSGKFGAVRGTGALWASGSLCTAGSPAAQTWRFFSQRIAFEEAYLLRFFGERYAEYARVTPTWIPGIA